MQQGKLFEVHTKRLDDKIAKKQSEFTYSGKKVYFCALIVLNDPFFCVPHDLKLNHYHVERNERATGH
jgi:hypothetical protein